MLRKFPFLIAFALAGALVASGCSKKAPQTAAASEGSQATSSTPSGASESDLASKGAAESGAGDLSGLPVVHFGFNEYTLTSEDRDNLKAASDTLKKATSKITVEGHCDERGSSEYNLALGERRAQSVKSYLQKLGVSPANIATISYGKERPADPGHNEEAWAKNRRGELVVNR